MISTLKCSERLFKQFVVSPRKLRFVRLTSVAPTDRAKETDLKGVLREKFARSKHQVQQLKKKYGKTKIGHVTVDMIYGGMRGLTGLVCDTSSLDPEEGIRFRGLTVSECRARLPSAPSASEPLPEAMFWLLLTGDVPSCEQTNAVSREWAQRAVLPSHALDVLYSLPRTLSPMAQLSCVLTSLSSQSVFAKAYDNGISKDLYWEYVYEDAINLLAVLPLITGAIYTRCYGSTAFAEVDPHADWAHNLCRLMGNTRPEFVELMRLYLTIHSDHEAGNVSAHATHLVGSALSDVNLALAAGVNGLAGLLHGSANKEVLQWLNKIRERYGDEYTDKQLETFILETLRAGKVIPGYGHAVLRKTDPRYTCQREFALKHLPDDPMVKLVSAVYQIAPPILGKLGKVSNPWPNVDAHSGVLLQHYGVKEAEYHTVLFAMSRSLGVLAQLVVSRAHALPIERPRSITTEALSRLLDQGEDK